MSTPLTMDPTVLMKLRAAYAANRASFEAELKKTLPAAYPLASGFVEVMDEAFFRGLPPDTPDTNRTTLSAADRERVLVALLASRGDLQFMMIHAYMGLMEGVSMDELGHIVFLTGIYSGVDRFTRSVGALAMLKRGLEASGGGNPPILDPIAILGKIMNPTGPFGAS